MYIIILIDHDCSSIKKCIITIEIYSTHSYVYLYYTSYRDSMCLSLDVTPNIMNIFKVCLVTYKALK